jgi:NAD/NADP transhydrogenase alpha subunit
MASRLCTAIADAAIVRAAFTDVEDVMASVADIADAEDIVVRAVVADVAVSVEATVDGAARAAAEAKWRPRGAGRFGVCCTATGRVIR